MIHGPYNVKSPKLIIPLLKYLPEMSKPEHITRSKKYAQNIPFRVLTEISSARKEHEILSSEKYSLHQIKRKPAPIH